MIWWILGGVVSLAVGFVVLLQVKFAMHEKHVRENGRPVLGMLAMANQTLYDPDGDPETAAFVIIGFERPSPEYMETMRHVGQRVHELYSDLDTASLSADEQEFAASMKQHNHTQGRRRRVPDDVTKGETFYVADIWVYRDRLLDGWEEHRALACIATGRDEGEIIHIGPDEEEGKALLEAAGVL